MPPRVKHEAAGTQVDVEQWAYHETSMMLSVICFMVAVWDHQLEKYGSDIPNRFQNDIMKLWRQQVFLKKGLLINLEAIQYMQ